MDIEIVVSSGLLEDCGSHRGLRLISIRIGVRIDVIGIRVGILTKSFPLIQIDLKLFTRTGLSQDCIGN